MGIERKNGDDAAVGPMVFCSIGQSGHMATTRRRVAASQMACVSVSTGRKQSTGTNSTDVLTADLVPRKNKK